MNKKRYIPLVVIGALILSLIAVYPAFGQGTAGFIDPDAIDDVNTGGVSDSPDPQTYGRQGGEIGLHLEDSSLDVPVRRVLIPGLDTTDLASSGVAHITAHSNVIYTTADLDPNEYVAVDMYPVRKVTASVKRTVVPAADDTADPPAFTTKNTSRDEDDTGNTVNNWYLMIQASDDGTTHTVTAANVAGIVDPEFGGFVASGAVTTTVTGAPSFLTVPAPTTADSDGNVAIAITAADGITTDDVMKDTTYAVEITVAQAADAGATPPVVAKTDKLTLNIHIYYPTMATLDRHFPKSTMATEDAATLGSVPVREINITDDNMTAAKWSDNYSKYALAIELVDSGTGANVRGNRFLLGDRLLANGNVADTNAIADRSIPDPFADAAALAAADQKTRVTGSTSGRITTGDAMVFTAPTGDPLASAPVAQDGIEYLRRDEIEFTDDGDAAGNYLVAWFDEANTTGSTVSVRSQAYSTSTTLVMTETGPDSNEFALKVIAVPFGTPTVDDPATEADEAVMRYEMTMANAMSDAGDPLPKVPVNPRDVVTLSSDDSAASLNIETTSPSFTGLSPANNTASDDNRPEVSAQVTDSDSGLDKKAIDILFLIEEGSNTTYKKVNPNSDGDIDAISGGFLATGRLDGRDAPDGDATISWWIRATDKAGNVGYSDQAPTNSDGTSDTCGVMGGFDSDDAGVAAEAEVRALDNDAKCDPFVILVDSTAPKLLRAETGRNWNSALPTGDSKDKTEYRVNKSNKSSVLVVFDSHLDATTVSASDFEVNGATPADATLYNVKVRDDVFDMKDMTVTADGTTTTTRVEDKLTGDGNSAVAGDNVLDVGERRGYVFLRLSADLSASAEPKVELKGDVLDLAGNEQDTGVDNDALDRIAPTLKVTIDEGSRPVTMDKVNLTIMADENIGTPKVTFHNVMQKTVDNETTQTIGSANPGTVKFVSSTEYSAVLSAGNTADGLYTIFVEATDSTGGNKGVTGDMTADVDVDSDTKAILFEHDENIGNPDVDPDKSGVQDTFSTDDMNGYIRIDFSAEANEYDMYMMDGERVGDDLDTHAGVTIVSATLNGDDIADALQSNEAGNVFLYRAPDGLAVGEHDLEVIAMDDAGNKHPSAKKATIEITERKPFSLKLNPGWNLVSIPGEPADPDINVVIPADRTDITSVLAYDPTVPGLWLSASRGADGMFSGTLKNITATRGYWVETNTFTALPVMIPKQSPGQARVLPTIPVAKGWNMVPVLDVDGNFKLEDGNDDRKDSDKLPTFKSDGTRGYLDGLDTDTTRAYTFNTITNRWDLVSEVQIGRGYWVYVAKAGIIVP